MMVELNGTEMTLSEATHFIPITKETYPSVLAQVYELLARAPTKKEEPPAEELEVEGAETLEAEPAEGPEAQAEAPAPRQPAAKPEAKPKAGLAAKDEAMLNESPKAESSKAEPQPVRAAEAANFFESQAEVTAGPAAAPTAVAKETSGAAGQAEAQAAASSVPDQNAGRAEPVGSASIEAVPSNEAEPLPDTEASWAVTVSEAETVTQSEFRLDEVEPTIFDEIISSIEIFEETDNEMTSEAIEDEIENGEPADFDETEIIWLARADNTEPEGLYQPADNRVAELPPPGGETEPIENALAQLAETIDLAEPATIEKFDQAIDKLVAIIEESEWNRAEYSNDQAEIPEELAEVLAELFDELEMEFTPEIIETLVNKIIGMALAGELKKPPIKNRPTLTSQYSWTHEAIIKPLAGLTDTGDDPSSVNALGEMVLWLAA
ncbi:MAG TPA: hypothetical protein VFK97_02665 [Candidatus Saccharimonadales bacterium]|nr:hypothetical protein [Candidatus Saccharimonadales bacterium]